MKKYLCFFLLLGLLIPAFSEENFVSPLLEDVTSDAATAVNTTIPVKKEPFPILFRGSISFVFTYLFDCQDGINHTGHFAPICYDRKDYRDSGEHHGDDGAGRIVGGNYGGIQFKVYSKYGFSVPVLNFDTPLTKDNFLQFQLLTDISPVTLSTGAEMTLAAAAFLQFQFGFFIGSGWDLPAFNAHGLAMNKDGTKVDASFSAPVLQLWFRPIFQFDLAYVLPPAYQKWTHFFILAKPQFVFLNYFGADYDEPFVYEADYGMQLNGWRLTGDFTTGYRIFIREDATGTKDRFLKVTNYTTILTFAFYANIDYLNLTHYSDSTMASGGWGSDFASVNFGPAIRLDLPFHLWTQFFFLFRNDRAYTEDTCGYGDFRKRVYEDYYVFAKSIGFFVGWDF